MTRRQRPTFTVGQKLEYVRLIVDEGYSNQQVMDISGAGKKAVSCWKRQYLAELNGHTPEGKKALTKEQQRIQELEKQLWQAKRDNDILKKANPDYRIGALCCLLGVKESTYYYHCGPKAAKLAELEVIAKIKAIAIETGYSYGKRRMPQA